MPEICNRCGELTAPPDRITSRAGLDLFVDAALAIGDAGAALAVEQELVAIASVSTCRLLRPRASARNVRAVEPRQRPRLVICE